MTVGAVLVAAGEGTRLGADRPKGLVDLAGSSLVAHAVARLRGAGITEVVVVGHPSRLQDTAAAAGPDVVVVAGGPTRSESVRCGLAALPEQVDVVAVHDAARALTPAATIGEAIAAVTGDVVASAPGLAVADTLKRVGARGRIETIPREGLVAVQTPQVVLRTVLEQAHESGGDATDDLALVERLLDSGQAQGRIVFTQGSPLALKITYEQDLVVAEALLAAEAGASA